MSDLPQRRVSDFLRPLRGRLRLPAPRERALDPGARAHGGDAASAEPARRSVRRAEEAAAAPVLPAA